MRGLTFSFPFSSLSIWMASFWNLRIQTSELLNRLLKKMHEQIVLNRIQILVIYNYKNENEVHSQIKIK
jgi:hypothetical protein